MFVFLLPCKKITFVSYDKYPFLLIKRNKILMIKCVLFDLENVQLGLENVLIEVEMVHYTTANIGGWVL